MRKLAIIFGLAQILTILLAWQFLPPQVPLFYSQPWGEEQIVTPEKLMIIPACSLVVFLLNSLFLSLLLKEESLLSQILNTTAVLFNLLGEVTLIQIVRIVL